MSQVAVNICIKEVGRTIIYRILRELEIVDQSNCPAQKYIDQGHLAVGLPRYTVKGRQIYVTLAVGLGGIYFIHQTVINYLADHQIPRVKRRKKIWH